MRIKKEKIEFRNELKLVIENNDKIIDIMDMTDNDGKEVIIQVQFDTISEMEEYLANVEKGEAPAMAFYTLSTKDYQNLSMNTADQKRYLKEILSIVEYYRSLDKKEGEEDE